MRSRLTNRLNKNRRVTAFPGPLDEVTGAEVALSWARRLTSVSWGIIDSVSDPILRLIRASDAEEKTFTYGANNKLDTAGIATFLSATTGDIVKVYDQTGNGFHREQSTASQQPLYEAAGIGSEPSADFLRADSQFLDGTVTGTSVPFTLYMVFRPRVTFVSVTLVGSHAGARRMLLFVDADTLNIFPNITNVSFDVATLVLGTDYVGVLRRDASDNLLWFESGTDTTVGSPTNSEATGFGHLGARTNGGSTFWDGLLSEVLYYQVDHSATDRETLEDNLGAFYGITIS